MTYNKNSIKSLSPIDHIRKRPSMYIPDIGYHGLHHLIEEVINNSVDEHLAGNGNEIRISLENDGSICINDFGRGIPFGYRDDLGMDTLTATFTKTLTGGKFDSDSYHTSHSGQNGIGIKAVTALSEYLKVVSSVSGLGVATQKFSRGSAEDEVGFEKKNPSHSGTYVHFKPDQEIFESVIIDWEWILKRSSQLASILPGLKIKVQNFRDSENKENPELQEVFFQENPLEFLHLTPVLDGAPGLLFNLDKSKEGLWLSYYQDSYSQINSFVNTIDTYDHGSHIDAIYKCLTDSLKKLTGKVFSKQQLTQGLILTLSIYGNDPHFRGQAKSRLADNKVFKEIYNKYYQYIYEGLKSNKEFVTYMITLADEQEKLIRNLDVKKAVSSLKASVKEAKLPPKLAVAYNADPDARELFIVEGDSAAGSVRMGRNPKFQEVLPIRGKIINAFKAEYSEVLANEEVKNLFLAIGAMENSNTPLRTKNVYILADADPDGLHIVSLVQSIFSVMFPSFIEKYNLYVVYPPKYTLISGDERMYGHSTKKLISQFKKDHKNKKYEISYNKGLGEQSPKEMKDVIHPKTRKISKCLWTKDSNSKMEALMGKMGELRQSLLKEDVLVNSTNED